MAVQCAFIVNASAPDASFWASLADRKLNEYRLDDQARSISAYFVCGSRQDATPLICLSSSSFESDIRAGIPRLAFHVPGTLRNCNTIEQFKQMDFASAADELATKIWNEIEVGQALITPSSLFQLLIVTFADLKKHQFLYWVAFPALKGEADVLISSPAAPLRSRISNEQAAILRAGAKKVQSDDIRQSVFLFVLDEPRVALLSQLPALVKEGVKFFVVVADPSCSPSFPGWPIRTVMILLAKYLPAETAVSIVCYRHDSMGESDEASIVIDLVVPKIPSTGPSLIRGWERNSKQQLVPRSVNLAASMDPKRLAETAVDLNLRLMKWRLLPSIDLERLSTTKCLLIGSGTLGCNVARILLGWGIRHITFVDNGKVSFSNPVRQSLFTFEDCLDGGREKSTAAAARLQAIFPSVVTKGVTMSIPMPGHPVDSSVADKTMEAVSQLEALVAEHDVVFLLTDSRESRWLPTVICAVQDKLCLTAAVGFDTFVAIRHGGVGADGKRVAGCYFCNDVVAPVNSVRDRTLDQQCTVSRPGVSSIVSASVVELMAAVRLHPLGNSAPIDETERASPLGLVPHQIRGSIADFNLMLLSGQPFDRCTACSSKILDSYKSDRNGLLMGSFNTPTFLEDLSGLSALKSSVEDEMSFDMSDDEFDEDVPIAN